MSWGLYLLLYFLYLDGYNDEDKRYADVCTTVTYIRLCQTVTNDMYHVKYKPL